MPGQRDRNDQDAPAEAGPIYFREITVIAYVDGVFSIDTAEFQTYEQLGDEENIPKTLSCHKVNFSAVGPECFFRRKVASMPF